MYDFVLQAIKCGATIPVPSHLLVKSAAELKLIMRYEFFQNVSLLTILSLSLSFSHAFVFFLSEGGMASSSVGKRT